ncbi:MAG: gas vesicle protein [Planctomycetota bacterium]
MSARKTRSRISKGRGSLKGALNKDTGGPAAANAGSDDSLVETLDRVLSRGVVVSGEVVISVAEIPLVYVGVQALVASVESAREAIGQHA